MTIQSDQPQKRFHLCVLTLIVATIMLPAEFTISDSLSFRLYDVAILSAFLYLVIRQRPALRRTLGQPVPLAYIALSIAAGVSVALNFWGQTGMLARGGMLCIRLLEPCLCYLLFAALYQPWMKTRLIRVFLLFATLAATFATAMCLLQVKAFCASGTLYLGNGLYHRAGGFLDDAVAFGFQCGLVLVAVLVLLWSPETRRGYLPWAVACLLTTGVALFLSASRSSMILVGVAIGYLLLFGAQRRARLVCLGLLAAGLVAGAVVYASRCLPAVNDYIDQRVLLLFQFNKENAELVSSDRVQIWKHYGTVLANNTVLQWVFGNGSGLFEKVIGAATYAADGVRSAATMSTHNTYLGALVGSGIVGAACFTALWVSALRATWRLRRQALGQCGFLMVLGSLIQMLFCDAMNMTPQLGIVFLVLGVAAADRLREAPVGIRYEGKG